MTGVLWVSGQSERYGADVSLLTAVRELQRRGWPVTVAVPGPGWLTDELTASGIAVEQIDPAVVRRVLSAGEYASLFCWKLPAGAARIARLARRHDLVHVNSSVVLGGLIGGRLSGRPVVCHLRESFAHHSRAWAVYAPLLQATCDAVVAVSEGVALQARRARLGGRTEVIHNGLDLAPYVGLRRPQGLGPVLTIGRINDWKGQPALVEAARLLHRRGCPVDVEIAGDVFPGGERYREQLIEQIRRAGLEQSVRLLGYVEDVPRLLAGVSVYVQPSSRPEPFGLALVQAMAAGRACIATDAGGPRDMIEHRRTGLLVPMGDAEALADAVEELAGDAALRERLGAAARREAAHRFTVEREVDRIEALYRRVLRCA